MNDLSAWITLVVPVRNEAPAIHAVLCAVRRIPELASVPIVVVDDGSDDGTPHVLGAIAAADHSIYYQRITRANKDVALCSGAQMCLTEWVVCMDGDGQYDPGDIPGLQLTERSARCGAVWGARLRRCDTAWRRLQSAAGRWIKGCVAGRLAVRDPGCGLFAMRCPLLRYILNAIPHPAGNVHCHLPEIVQALGYDVVEHAVNHLPRTTGAAKYGAVNRILSGYRSLRQARRLISTVKVRMGAVAIA